MVSTKPRYIKIRQMYAIMGLFVAVVSLQFANYTIDRGVASQIEIDPNLIVARENHNPIQAQAHSKITTKYSKNKRHKTRRLARAEQKATKAKAYKVAAQGTLNAYKGISRFLSGILYREKNVALEVDSNSPTSRKSDTAYKRMTKQERRNRQPISPAIGIRG